MHTHLCAKMMVPTVQPVKDDAVKAFFAKVKETLISKPPKMKNSPTNAGDNKILSSTWFVDSAPFEHSIKNNDGSLYGPNTGAWCNWFYNSSYCNNKSPYKDYSDS